MATDEKNELSFDRMKSSFLGKITSAKEKISSKIDDVLRDESSSNSSSSSTTATSEEASVQSSSSSMSFPTFEFGSSTSSSSSLPSLHILPPQRQQTSLLPVNTSIGSISERKIKYKTLFAELNQNVVLKTYINELSDSFHEIQISPENCKDTSSFVAKLDDAFSLLASSLPTVTSKSSLTITRYSTVTSNNIQ